MAIFIDGLEIKFSAPDKVLNLINPHIDPPLKNGDESDMKRLLIFGLRD